jgi:hypothetical protein
MEEICGVDIIFTEGEGAAEAFPVLNPIGGSRGPAPFSKCAAFAFVTPGESKMNSFEYRVTFHPADAFREMILFCSQEGSCNADMVPSEQMRKMESLLNEGGLQGWELVQASFGKEGVLVFWKREIH